VQYLDTTLEYSAFWLVLEALATTEQKTRKSMHSVLHVKYCAQCDRYY
jgi:hypothetical protein